MSIAWYEWLGWLVEALLLVLALLVIGSTISEGEMRPTVVSAAMFGAIIGLWTWIMVRYGKQE